MQINRYLLSTICVVSDLKLTAYESFRTDICPEHMPTLRLRYIPKSFDLSNVNSVAAFNALRISRLVKRWIISSIDPREKCVISVKEDYSEADIYYEEQTETTYLQDVDMLIRVVVECFSLRHGTYSLHSAAVVLEGKSIAFTGSSGIGKSTRAQAWMSTLHAEQLSGDRPHLYVDGKQCFLSGVPWDGKEQCFRNAKYPLKALGEVRRAGFVRVRKLSAEQRFSVLLQQTFLPMWDVKLAAEAIAYLRIISKTIPMYRIFCGPDAFSARELYRILFLHPEEIREESLDMKAKAGFTLRNVMGENIIMPTGDNIGTYTGTVILNEVSAFVWRKLEKPITFDDLLDCILDEYEIDRETAASDLKELIEKLQSYDIIE